MNIIIQYNVIYYYGSLYTVYRLSTTMDSDAIVVGTIAMDSDAITQIYYI